MGTDDEPVPEPVGVSDLSDGLSGEMYAEDGWIAQYSRYEDYMPQLVDGEWRDPDTS